MFCDRVETLNQRRNQAGWGGKFLKSVIAIEEPILP